VSTFSSLLEDSVGDFQTKIVNGVKYILTESLDRAKTEIETINNSTDDKINNFSLSDFVSKYVNKVLEDDIQKEYDYLKFEADGSKLIVSIDLQHNTSLNDLGLDFGTYGKISASGKTELSAEVNVSAAIDLSTDDFQVETPVVKKLLASINDLGMSAQFMNFSVTEKTLENEETPDVEFVYEQNEVKKKLNLEFQITSVNGLPFTVSEGELLTVESSNNVWNVNVPNIQLNDSLSLVNLFNNVEGEINSLLKDIPFPFNGGDYTIESIIGLVNDVWSNASVALNGAIVSSADKVELYVERMVRYLESVFGENVDKLKSLVSSIEVKAKENDSGIKLFDSVSGFVKEINADIQKLQSSSNTFSLVINPNIDKLSSFSLLGMDLENIETNSSLVVNVNVGVNDGVPSFNGVDLEKFSVSLSKLNSAIPSYLPVTFDQNNDYVSVFVENGSWDYHIPQVKMKDGFSLEDLVSGIDLTSIPLLNQSPFTLKEVNYDVALIFNVAHNLL
jgi:hypothetical protein